MNSLIRVKPLSRMPFELEEAPSDGPTIYPLARAGESGTEVTEKILSQALSVKSKELDVVERISVFGGHTAIACEWLRYRGSGERKIEISSSDGGWGGRSYRTRVRIS